MNNSLDIETLGIAPGSTIVSIGVTQFDLNRIHHTFYRLIELNHGETNPKTLEWWEAQSVDARKELIAEPRVPIDQALSDLVRFVGKGKVWGFGSDFDNVLLLDWCRRLNIQGWSHRQNRCLRTLAGLFDPDRLLLPHNALPHHALHDSMSQAIWIQKIAKANGIKL